MSSGGGNGMKWAVGAFVASVVGHAVSVAAIPRWDALAFTRPSVPPQELELIMELPPPEEVVAPVEEPAPVRREPTEVRPTPPETTTVTAVTDTPPETTTIVDPREIVPETTHTPDQTARIVDTRLAARSVLETDGPRMPRAADTTTMDVETPEQRDRRLAGALDTTLRAAAVARPEGFGRRELPEPVRRPDGTLAYPLGQVTAIVNRDGSFTFDDTSGVDFEGMGGAERDGVSTRWGLEEWMMRRRGADPHASTRRWFALQTESMREEMTQRYMEGQARSAARGMRGRLSRLLADETRPIADRRRAAFEQWDECSEGELIGDAVRAAIVAVIVERLPQGSADAYGDSELDELNRRRESTAEFRPYAR